MSEHKTQPSPRILRMEEELGQLKERLQKIHDFTKTEAWNGVNKINQELLGAQYSAMSTYARILNIRLKIAYGEDAKTGRPAEGTERPPVVGRSPQDAVGRSPQVVKTPLKMFRRKPHFR